MTLYPLILQEVFVCLLQDLVPMDTQVQIGNSKDHIKLLYNSVSKLRDIAERMVQRSTSYASDMLQFGRELRYMAGCCEGID